MSSLNKPEEQKESKKPQWECDLAILMGKLVGWRDADFDQPLIDFIHKVRQEAIKETKEEIGVGCLKCGGPVITVRKKKHRHSWGDRCDCEYCEYEQCTICGEERYKNPFASLKRRMVGWPIMSDKEVDNLNKKNQSGLSHGLGVDE